MTIPTPPAAVVSEEMRSKILRVIWAHIEDGARVEFSDALADRITSALSTPAKETT